MPLFHQLRFAFVGRLAAFYATLFVLMGVQLLFLPVWLKARGLDASLIGVALALPMVVRLWGSAAFIAGTFGAGYVSDVLPARDLIWLIVAAAAALVLAELALAPLPGAAAPSAAAPAPKRHLLRDPAFLAVARGRLERHHHRRVVGARRRATRRPSRARPCKAISLSRSGSRWPWPVGSTG
ncbi:MAG: hypothetical protein P8Z80_00470 [Pseudolabrys sp.]